MPGTSSAQRTRPARSGPLVSGLLPPCLSFPSRPRARDHRRDRGIPSPLLHAEITALLPLNHPVTPLGTHLPSERDPEPNTAALAKPRRAETLRRRASAAALPPEPPQALQEFRRASRSPSAHSFPGSEPCNAGNSFSAAPPASPCAAEITGRRRSPDLPHLPLHLRRTSMSRSVESSSSGSLCSDHLRELCVDLAARRNRHRSTSLVVAVPGSSQFELCTSRDQPVPSQLSPVP